MGRGPLGRVGTRLVAPIIVLLVLLVALLGWRIYVETAGSRTQTLSTYARLLNRLVMTHLRDAMLGKDRPRLQRQITEIAALETIGKVRLVDKHGKVVVASDAREIGRTIPQDDRECIGCHQPRRPPLTNQTFRLEEGNRPITRAAQVITVEPACTRCHDEPEGTVLGVLVTDLDGDLLTGGLPARMGRAVWLAAAMALLILVVLVLAIRTFVVLRVRNLRRLVDGLRGGARNVPLVETTRDELDDLARSLQAFALDVDGRIALQHGAQAVANILEGHAGPALVLDEAGHVVAANRRAIARLGPPPTGPLLGLHRDALPASTTDRLGEARERGWSLPRDQGPGPILSTLADAGGGAIAFLETWPEDETEGEMDGLPVTPPPGPGLDELWLLYATALLSRVHKGAAGWKGILAFDRRLVVARHLMNEIAVEAPGLLQREEFDLAALTSLALEDGRRQRPDVRWQTLADHLPTVVGSRFHLHVLVDHLLRTAGHQAGPRGQVVLIQRLSAEGRRVFLGAWAGRPGAHTPLSPAGTPPLAIAIARAHGGDVEVDPAFELRPFCERHGVRPPESSLGSLYVAQIASDTQGS